MTTAVRYAIGIDVGGTRIKTAAVGEDGSIVDRRSASTRGGSLPEWRAAVARLVAEHEAALGGAAEWIGAASPGIPSRDGRSVASVHGPLAELRDARWDELLGAGRPVPVVNDALAALLGEAWLGAAAGFDDVVLLTLGTGVGGAILAGGRPLLGRLGRAGHLGHVCLDPDGPPGATGLPGSLEDAIGDRTVAARSGGRFASTRELVGAYLAGDEAAARVWLRSVHVLACAIASLVNVLDPEAVVLGGGIARAGRALFDPLAERLGRLEWRPYGDGVRVLPAALGEFAGAIGAARNAIDAAA